MLAGTAADVEDTAADIPGFCELEERRLRAANVPGWRGTVKGLEVAGFARSRGLGCIAHVYQGTEALRPPRHSDGCAPHQRKVKIRRESLRGQFVRKVVRIH